MAKLWAWLKLKKKSMLPESLKLAQHYQASYQPGIWWVLNRGSESAHSRGGYSSGFWTVSCCWLLRALGGGRCSAVLFLMEQATFRPACILLHLYQMGLVLSFPKWSQQQQYWIQERAFSTVCWIFTEWNWIFFRKPPDEWSFMPCVNKKNIFYMKSIYNSSFPSTSLFFLRKAQVSFFIHKISACHIIRCLEPIRRTKHELTIKLIV